MKFHAEQFKHDQAEKIGILLVNLGSPDAPDAASIRRFLREFLSDQRVIEMPKFVWQLILNLLVLPFRPKRLVPLYQAIWTSEGSPLVAIAEKQKNKLEAAFIEKGHTHLNFALAMRYGNPDIASAIRQFARDNVHKVLVFPTYAQYSGSTTASIFDAVSAELQQWRWIPELRFINSYHDQAQHIQALADSVQTYWQTHKKGKKLIMSFHGLPKVYLSKGDPYFCQCHKTARLLADKLKLDESQWTITFQSRFGKQEWLKPYTSKTLADLAQQGIDEVDVICPGFAIDCLETLEEIAVENRDVFLNAGGKQYQYIPALNDSDTNIKAMAALIEQHTQGWQVISDSRALAERKSRQLKVDNQKN
ncbi:MAG: ferrochelatase [gamma proteobacterium symbiont of Bathyaustriella thionipta]|nr:ferrochelatase [gamma proteobacterium symbiont of Bathyaustriella thionipta]MCU7949532.1 ferrochelatase [gamma proteobacterium symbiont of Bathyaustriella thionipta]MCU7954252.1 ferrochelatase [gamma proteobacterium symbiont of Bathyaustriella thionipta]MCU7956132.1 ferrochelatase [gamma proteobacterium symbiont of Bathyaustriella thionipta]MCU7968733.1 ferrochelatase [gamma proteobacterium symbiont of Bathyaustriella thionipta]